MQNQQPFQQPQPQEIYTSLVKKPKKTGWIITLVISIILLVVSLATTFTGTSKLLNIGNDVKQIDTLSVNGVTVVRGLEVGETYSIVIDNTPTENYIINISESTIGMDKSSIKMGYDQIYSASSTSHVTTPNFSTIIEFKATETDVAFIAYINEEPVKTKLVKTSEIQSAVLSSGSLILVGIIAGIITFIVFIVFIILLILFITKNNKYKRQVAGTPFMANQQQPTQQQPTQQQPTQQQVAPQPTGVNEQVDNIQATEPVQATETVVTETENNQ